MSGFNVNIRSEFWRVYVFYPYDQWDGALDLDDEQDLRKMLLMEKCLQVCPRMESEIEDLMDEITSNMFEESVALICDPNAEVELMFAQDDLPSNPFVGHRKPELKDLIPDAENSKFCFVKIVHYEGDFKMGSDDEWDKSKLTYVNGKFLYDGDDCFSIGDDEGLYGTTEQFYKDGELVVERSF